MPAGYDDAEHPDLWHAFYDSVTSQDYARSAPCGAIQWKGTNVCIDLYCTCGAHSHVDADFFYHFRCHACGACYAVGSVVKLIPLTSEQATYVETRGGFVSDGHFSGPSQRVS